MNVLSIIVPIRKKSGNLFNDPRILNTISKILNLNQIVLFRDDGLIYIPISNSPKTSNRPKKIIREFKNLGFKIEILSNIKIANFVDLTFDNSNKPSNENNDIPSYINVNSNHPGCIIKQIPTAVNVRINRLSSSKRIFEIIKNYMKI